MVLFNFVLQSLRARITEEKEDERHVNADAFLCVVMSEGSRGSILPTSDDQETTSPEDIITAFDDDHWPQMARKPKMFLFHTCEGARKFSMIALRVTGNSKVN